MSLKDKMPEERQTTSTKSKKTKLSSAEKEAFKGLRNGRIIIFVLAGLMGLSAFVEYRQLEMVEVFYIYAPIIVCYLVLGFVYYTNPYVASIVALSIYGLLLLLVAFTDPASLPRGIFVKIIIIVGLVTSIKYGKDYNTVRKRKKSALLDDELIS